MKTNQTDIQGHRGCRGVMPENTLSAFKKALETGVTTLEMDVVISKDCLVVVSHEPWFNSEITTTPGGVTLTQSEGQALNIYNMNYTEVNKYDVGKKFHPRFPGQQKRAEYKPLLNEVFLMTEDFCKKNNRTIRYNIEIKSTEEEEKNGYQPSVPVFCKLVMQEINKLQLEKVCIIQSFDVRVLNYLHSHFPNQALSYLVENNRDYVSALKLLNFIPQVYSCDYVLVSKQMIADLHLQNIKVIPWTVNQETEIKRMLQLGVDGIISDYPNKVLDILNE